MPRRIYPRTKKHLEILDNIRKLRKVWVPWNKGKKCPQLHGRKKGTKVPSISSDKNSSKSKEVRLKIGLAKNGKPS